VKRTILAITCGGLALYVAVVVFQLVKDRAEPIEGLIDPITRLRTYHGLWVETESAQKNSFYKPLHRYSNFVFKHRSIHLLRIPVPDDPDRPLYLTLRDVHFGVFAHRDPPWSSWATSVDPSSWKSWFSRRENHVAAPPLGEPNSESIDGSYVISLHSHDGKLLDEEKPRPFGGNNMTGVGEIVFDINRDGWVERVATKNLGFKDPGAAAELLTITRINRETEEIFHAVINVGRDEFPPEGQWGFVCVDGDRDGTLEVGIGPKNGSNVTPEVFFSWNSVSGEFESPGGRVGPHFLVLTGEKHWETLNERYEQDRLSYPLDR